MTETLRTPECGRCAGTAPRRGGGSIPLDVAAEQVGLTKPGLMYHVPTKEALMVGVVGHTPDDSAYQPAARTQNA
ncbi:hypothetical protein ACIO8F_11260 [Streptomyces sp. NPDC087228]|uniref:hypothetical protein n=1 Tax=unclassified Streptomyces TaxID=2593676 RepID=UPI0038047C55